MHTITLLITTYSFLFSVDTTKTLDVYYRTKADSYYSINDHKYAVSNIRLRDGIIDANYYGEAVNGETVKGEVTFKFFKNIKSGVKIYAVDNTPFLKNDNYVAIRYDYMLGSKPPSPSVVSKRVKGQTITVVKQNEKVSITSKGITMNDGSKLTFNIIQQ